jgi:hypothetical protein
MTMKYRGFWRKTVCNVTRDTTSAALTFSRWFGLQRYRIASWLVLTVVQWPTAAAAVVDAQSVDARLAMGRPHHLRHAGREIVSYSTVFIRQYRRVQRG